MTPRGLLIIRNSSRSSKVLRGHRFESCLLPRAQWRSGVYLLKCQLDVAIVVAFETEHKTYRKS